jgi:hypothetical protein
MLENTADETNSQAFEWSKGGTLQAQSLMDSKQGQTLASREIERHETGFVDPF